MFGHSCLRTSDLPALRWTAGGEVEKNNLCIAIDLKNGSFLRLDDFLVAIATISALLAAPSIWTFAAGSVTSLTFLKFMQPILNRNLRIPKWIFVNRMRSNTHHSSNKGSKIFFWRKLKRIIMMMMR